VTPAPARRLAEHLSAKIRESGLTQSAVSTALGWGPDYVNQLLRGNLDLRLAHVYAILGTLEVSPARFFGELHANADSRQRAFVERLLPELLAQARAALLPASRPRARSRRRTEGAPQRKRRATEGPAMGAVTELPARSDRHGEDPQ
jgi:transcriptional regulator with XRE-family HTH domain